MYRNPIVLAREWYARTHTDVNRISQNQLAGVMGVNRARVTQVLKLLELPSGLQNAVVALGDPLTWPSITERRLRTVLKASEHTRTEVCADILRRIAILTTKE